MTRSVAVFALALLAAALCAPHLLFAAEATVSESPDHALLSAENHNVLAPGSSREFRLPETQKPADTRKAPGTQQAQKPAQKPITAQKAPGIPQRGATPQSGACPPPLYRLRKAPAGWTLSIKEQPGLACAVLLSPPSPTAGVSYALRSSGAIGNTRGAKILSGTRLLGAEDGLHFLASSAYVSDPELGRALVINIPERAVYGYNDGGAFESRLVSGGSLRVRLYGLPYAHPMSAFSTYTIPLP